MKKNTDSAAFANLLGETFQSADEQRAFERDVLVVLGSPAYTATAKIAPRSIPTSFKCFQ